MKLKYEQISKNKKCYDCWGCNRLEDPKFNAVYRCQDYLKCEGYRERNREYEKI